MQTKNSTIDAQDNSSNAERERINNEYRLYGFDRGPAAREGSASRNGAGTHGSQSPFDHLKQTVDEARKARDGRPLKTFCPVHESSGSCTDHTPSLEVSVNSRGKLKAVCRSRGCEVETSLKGLGLLRVRWHRVATYLYRDEHGELSYRVYKEEDGNGEKRFRQQQASGAWTVKGVEPLLYDLPELTAAPKEIIRFGFEGERDCETAKADGLLATTISGGAQGRMPARKCFEALGGCTFVFSADNDPPGRKHAGRMARAALEAGARVKIIWQLSRDAKDYTEFRERGGTVDEFKALVEGAPFVTAESLPADTVAEVDHYESYEAAREAMNQRYAAIETEFYVLATRKRVDPRRLDLTCTIHYRNEKGDFVPAAPRWRTDPLHLKLVALVWKPGDTAPITAADELNLFTELPSDPMKADGSPFLQLYFLLRDHVLHDPVERAYFEWLIAYRYTHLSAKIPLAILLRGPQGAGKSLLMLVIGILLFGAYLTTPTAKEMSRDFNRWALLKLLSIFEEASADRGAATSASFKNMLRQAVVTINAKYQTEVEYPDYLMHTFTMNDDGEIPLDRDDRCVFVMRCDGVLDACLPGLSAWILSVLFPDRAATAEDKAAWRLEHTRAGHELARYFTSIDLNQFSITAPAMMTPAKRIMLAKQRTNLDEKADALVAEARDRQAAADEASRLNSQQIAPHFSNLTLFPRTLAMLSRDEDGPIHKVAWRKALNRCGARAVTDADGEERQVKVPVFDRDSKKRWHMSCRPFALINAAYWDGVEPSVLTKATADYLVACGSLMRYADGDLAVVCDPITRCASKY